MTPEQITRLRNTFEEVARACERVIETWDNDLQREMAIEEMGELLTALARYRRNRGSAHHVVEEAADVIITALQIGLMYGLGSPDELIEVLGSKTARLVERLERNGVLEAHR